MGTDWVSNRYSNEEQEECECRFNAFPADFRRLWAQMNADSIQYEHVLISANLRVQICDICGKYIMCF
jgi:hypothetical protein